MQDHRSRFLGSATTGSLMDLRAGFGDGRRERPRRLAEARAPPPAPAFLRQESSVPHFLGRQGDRETSAPHWETGRQRKRACLTGETGRQRKRRASLGDGGDRETRRASLGRRETEKRRASLGGGRPGVSPGEHPVTMGRPLRAFQGSTDLIKQNSKESEETECG